MAVRPIDANELLGIERLLDTDVVRQSKTASWLLDQVLHDIQAMSTLTPPNEPLTLISMSDEIPPDNERVLVYRPCMVDSDTGPYSVQWGWAAKRDGSHWARLPDRRPPEGGDADHA